MQMPLLRTVVSMRGYAHAAIVAWRFMHRGFSPKKEQIGVLYAQWIIETGAKDCWNWNIGNKKVTQAQVNAGIPWIDLPGTWEMINGKKVVLEDGDPGRRFRAYASLEAGMSEHLDALRHKWTSCWPHVLNGDTHGFAHALKAGKDGIEGTWDDYFTGSVDTYANVMASAHKSWMSSSAFDDALEEVERASEAETQPEMPAAPPVPDFDIVHPPVDFIRPPPPDDEPPPQAA
jgi:hypothetical protein